MKFKKSKYSMFHTSSFKKNGFTFFEIIFAMGLFLLVITAVTGVFVKSSQIQRKVIELHTVQREGNYMMEMMSREIRMAAAINVSQATNSDHDIEFTNYNTDSVEYFRSDSGGNRSDNGKYLARKGKVISSSNIEITNLKFYSNDFTVKQPMVTISMTVKPAITQHNTEISLQNSVALRVY